MFRSISAISLLLALSLPGQDAAPVAPAASKWSIGVNVSPDITSHRLEVIQPNAIGEGYIGFREMMEIPRFGYSASIMAGHAFNDRLGIEAGVGYALRGWQLDMSKLTFGDQIDPRRGFVYNTGTAPLNAIRRDFHYLTVPVRGTISFGQGRLRSITGLGLSADILLRANSVMMWGDDPHARELTGINTFNITPFISTGAAYRPGGRSEIRLEPIFRYGVLKLREGPVAERLWSGGLNAAWFLRL